MADDHSQPHSLGLAGICICRPRGASEQTALGRESARGPLNGRARSCRAGCAIALVGAVMRDKTTQ